MVTFFKHFSLKGKVTSASLEAASSSSSGGAEGKCQDKGQIDSGFQKVQRCY